MNTSLSPAAGQKIDEALLILREIGLAKAQQNNRSALALLALLGMPPHTDWAQASAPLLGITEIMSWIASQYDIHYAPNTRETVRRQTIHQFAQAGIIFANPDAPARPINSPHTRYQIEPRLLKIARDFGQANWRRRLADYGRKQSKIALIPREREPKLIPLVLPSGTKLDLTAGGQNTPIKQIIENFCPRFTPHGVVVYVGDAGDKLKLFASETFEQLGLRLDKHGKMPDVIVHMQSKNWLVLIEAVTSHGPIDIKRHIELKHIFGLSSAGLVFVTAFENRKSMLRYLSVISWETDVWLADAPDHLIHFNGDRFLGPYTS